METKTGVVVFLDALGVSNRTLEESINFVLTRDELITGVKRIWELRGEQFRVELENELPQPEIAIFQDSIIICWPEQKGRKQDLLPLFLAAGQWLTDAITFAIGMKIFYRGAISIGEYIFNASAENITVIGPAITDAYSFHDCADWIGVIQTPNCQKQYQSFLEADARQRNEKINPDFYEFLFVRYLVPLHDGKNEEFYALSWPMLSCKIDDEHSISEDLLDMSHSVNPEYKSKYDNATLFFEWYKKNIFPKINYYTPPSRRD